MNRQMFQQKRKVQGEAVRGGKEAAEAVWKI